MEITEIQNKKLNLIEQLIIIEDDDVINKIEEILNESLQRPLMKKFTKEELINRARLANKDIENGKTFTQEEIESISQDW